VEYDAGTGVWAACGATSNNIRTSSNLTSWSGQTVPVAANLNGIVSNGTGHWTVAANWGVILQSDNATPWTNRTDFGSTLPLNGLYSVAYGNGVFVAVGNAGVLLSSTDGEYWTTRDALTTTNILRKVVFANNTFVVVGGTSAAIIRTSTDGITWTIRTPGTTNQLNDVAFGMAGPTPRWVAVGNSGTIIYSDDLATWTAATSGASTNNVNCITYANGLWVAGNSGNIANIRYSSTGSGTWTAATGTTNNLSVTDIAFLNDTFIATSTVVYRSTNGTAWTTTTIDNSLALSLTNYIDRVNNKLIAFYINPSLTGSFRPIFVGKSASNWFITPFNQKGISIQDIAYSDTYSRPTISIAAINRANFNNNLPWRNLGGDWWDANYTINGTAPWATLFVNDDDGPGRTFTINITNLMQAIYDHPRHLSAIILVASSGGITRYATMEYATVENRPQISYDGGAYQYIINDTGLGAGSFGGLPNDAEFNVLPPSNWGRLILNIPPPVTRPTSTVLKLYSPAQFGNMTTEVYWLRYPFDSTPGTGTYSRYVVVGRHTATQGFIGYSTI